MRRRHSLRPGVECVEPRLSPSTLGAPTPAIPSTADASVRHLDLENTAISQDSVTATSSRPGGAQQIIAILIG